MPTYTYACGVCGDAFDTFQCFAAEPLLSCQGCGGDLARVLYPPTFHDATPRTLGARAERNEAGAPYWVDKQRHDLAAASERANEQRSTPLPTGMRRPTERPETPWWRDSPKINTGLTELTPKQQSNYIMTGDSRGS